MSFKSLALFSSAVCMLVVFGCSTINSPVSSSESTKSISASVPKVELATIENFSAKSAGWSIDPNNEYYINAIDESVSTKAKAGKIEDTLEFNLHGTFTLNRAYILEDNDGTMQLGSWKVQYYNGTWGNCFDYKTSNTTAWQEVNFTDVHAVTKARLICKSASGKTIEIQEFRLLGTPEVPVNLLPGPWVFEHANVDPFSYTIIGNEIDVQCEGSYMNVTSLPYEGGWFSQNVPAIVANGRYQLTLEIYSTGDYPVICSAKLCGTQATSAVPAATDGYFTAVMGYGTITFDFTAPASVVNPTVEIANRPLIVGGDGTYGVGIENHTITATLVKLP